MSRFIEFHFHVKGVINRRERVIWLRPVSTTWEQVIVEAQKAGYENVRAKRRMWPAYAWPGGYPIYYITRDGGVLSPMAANRELTRTLDPDDDQFFVVGQGINWEDPDLICDHLGIRIESAYAEREAA